MAVTKVGSITTLTKISVDAISCIVAKGHPVKTGAHQEMLRTTQRLNCLTGGNNPTPLDNRARFITLDSPIRSSADCAGCYTCFLGFLGTTERLNCRALLLARRAKSRRLHSVVSAKVISNITLVSIAVGSPQVRLTRLSDVPIVSVKRPVGRVGIPYVSASFVRVNRVVVRALYHGKRDEVLFTKKGRVSCRQGKNTGCLVQLEASVRSTTTQCGVRVSRRFASRSSFSTTRGLLREFVSDRGATVIARNNPLFLGGLITTAQRHKVGVPRSLSLVSTKACASSVNGHLEVSRFPLVPTRLYRLNVDVLIQLVSKALGKGRGTALVRPMCERHKSVTSH